MTPTDGLTLCLATALLALAAISARSCADHLWLEARHSACVATHGDDECAEVSP